MTKIKNIKLPKLNTWWLLFPWVILVCVLLIAIFAVFFEVNNAKREESFASKLLLEKGEALILAFENALRTGMSLHWTDEELQDLMEKMANQDGVYYLLLATTDGKILAGSNINLSRDFLLMDFELEDRQPSDLAKFSINKLNNQLDVFEVYKKFTVETYKKRFKERKHHGMMFNNFSNKETENHSSLNKQKNKAKWQEKHSIITIGPQDLILVVGFDTTPLNLAKKADNRRTIITLIILGFLISVAVITLYLIHKYRISRQLVQETTAFSSEIIQTLPVGIIATDENNLITSVNQAALKILRRTDLDKQSVVGLNVAVFMPSIWEELEPVISKGQAVLDYESRFTLSNKEQVPLSLSASCIITEDKEYIGNAVIIRDLGEIRLLQTELRQRDRLAALGNMAAGIAHEIRNPLSAIKGFARFFAELGYVDGEEGKAVKFMLQEVQRLDRVVSDLLNFAKSDRLNITKVNLEELILKAQRLVQSDLDAQHIVFKKHLSESPFLVYLDVDAFIQVLLNLFLNAIQAMPGGGELTINAWVVGKFKSESDAQEYNQDTLLDLKGLNTGRIILHIEIIDTGIGIDLEKTTDIFTPYFTTKASGTGLGLSIVHKITEAHGGDIKVKSFPGKGTTFILGLPQ